MPKVYPKLTMVCPAINFVCPPLVKQQIKKIIFYHFFLAAPPNPKFKKQIMRKVCPILARVYPDFNFFCSPFIKPKNTFLLFRKAWNWHALKVKIIYKFKIIDFHKIKIFKYVIKGKENSTSWNLLSTSYFILQGYIFHFICLLIVLYTTNDKFINIM